MIANNPDYFTHAFDILIVGGKVQTKQGYWELKGNRELQNIQLFTFLSIWKRQAGAKLCQAQVMLSPLEQKNKRN